MEVQARIHINVIVTPIRINVIVINIVIHVVVIIIAYQQDNRVHRIVDVITQVFVVVVIHVILIVQVMQLHVHRAVPQSVPLVMLNRVQLAMQQIIIVHQDGVLTRGQVQV